MEIRVRKVSRLPVRDTDGWPARNEQPRPPPQISRSGGPGAGLSGIWPGRSDILLWAPSSSGLFAGIPCFPGDTAVPPSCPGRMVRGAGTGQHPKTGCQTRAAVTAHEIRIRRIMVPGLRTGGRKNSGFQRSSRMMPGISEGLDATGTPMAFSRWILERASPSPPSMMAPACPIRFSGGADIPAM